MRKSNLLVILLALATLFAGAAQAHDKRGYGHGHNKHNDRGHSTYRRHGDRYSGYRNHDPIRQHNRYYRNGRHRDKDRYYSYGRHRNYGYSDRGHGRYRSYSRHERRRQYGHHGHYHRHDPIVRIAVRLLDDYFHCPDHGGYFRHGDLYYSD